MLKIIMRIFLILLAAGLISGVLYWVVNSSSGSAGLGNFDRPGSALSIFQPGLRGRDLRGGGAAQTLALTDILVKLGLIGLMTVVVVLLQRVIARFIKTRKVAKTIGVSS
jgi:hypothetical protein